MNLWRYLFNLEERRGWYLRRIRGGPLREFYEIPFPNPDSDWRRVDYLAMDLETTGFEPGDDEILSIGWVNVRGAAVRLGEAGHLYVRPRNPIPEKSAVIHGILDDRAAAGEPLEEVLPRVLRALAGKVLVAHHAAIEYEFLGAACKRLYGYGLACPVVDTLALEVRRFRAEDRPMRSGDLRLARVRERYGLPRYPAHDALSDAIAAAELFLAQASHRSARRALRLRDLTVIS